MQDGNYSPDDPIMYPQENPYMAAQQQNPYMAPPMPFQQQNQQQNIEGADGYSATGIFSSFVIGGVCAMLGTVWWYRRKAKKSTVRLENGLKSINRKLNKLSNPDYEVDEEFEEEMDEEDDNDDNEWD